MMDFFSNMPETKAPLFDDLHHYSTDPPLQSKNKTNGNKINKTFIWRFHTVSLEHPGSQTKHLIAMLDLLAIISVLRKKIFFAIIFLG